MDIQNVGFLAKTLTLASPTPADLMKAYQSLSARGSVTITCAPAEIGSVLLSAENAGFFGMRVDGTSITAHKGKEGPCYDSGRSARYLGSAAAVLDDDNHLLSGTLRVCEKTGRLYASEAYRGRLEVTEPDPSLLARLEKDPAPFDCDTFQADAKSLAEALKPQAAREGGTPIFYPGPFKLLILRDGTMVRRGRLELLSREQAEELKARDGAWINPDGQPGPARIPENYVDLYRKDGAACLLGDLSLQPRPAGKDPSFDALDEVPPAMKRRLLALLDRNEDYFILTGSDPAQKDGCCPSNDVGIANHLVEAGILDSHGAGSNSDCPVTLYAFHSEIRAGVGKPRFARSDAFRAAVRRRLESGPHLSQKAVLRLALLVLFAGAVLTLGLALFRQLLGR
ncbi:MAG TPA: hypothetical protein VNM14_00070 [Planctomycetota bacterium]|jgi:hypothetical protein|nr:hypothetical protein [Planctomycetota bacterium]